MKHLLTTAAAMASLVALNVSAADYKIYGKVNASFELASEGEEDHTQLKSNASRIGFKGSEAINDNLSAIYQLEYQIEPDDGDTFSQRNIYVGLKGNFGSVIAGHFDTPFKKAQKKVDQFNDLHGDIKNIITSNDKRMSNSVMYVSPEIAGGVQLYVDFINSETEALDDGVSLAATYTYDNLYIAVAADSDVAAQGTEAVRFVVQYKLDAFQLGFLAEQSEAEGADAESGAMVSVSYKATDKWVVKAQAGQSDIMEEGGTSLSIGADYKVSKTFKAFGFVTGNESDNDVTDNAYAGAGVELKF